MRFKEDLKNALTAGLPGLTSQLKMVPEIRRREIENRRLDNDTRKAAVLICFYPGENGGIELALIRRNEYDGVHSGQISFPGGGYEEGDKDLVDTALREAEEEVNIRAGDVEVLGEISPVYIPPSNFFVKPVIGWLDERPAFIPEINEVQEVISLNLEEITDPGCVATKNIEHREFRIIDVPCFYIRGHIIWGATAMMLSEIVDIVGNIR
ncbi:MAG TPA: CoA pyrophosphatase [Bacteroidales bacterium]|nr:CoA pyrophosphatase [Bacteroidales bacterium]